MSLTLMEQLLNCGVKPRIKKVGVTYYCAFNFDRQTVIDALIGDELAEALTFRGVGKTPYDAYSMWQRQVSRRKPPQTVDFVRKEGKHNREFIVREIKIAACFGFLGIFVFCFSEWLL